VFNEAGLPPATPNSYFGRNANWLSSHKLMWWWRVSIFIHTTVQVRFLMRPSIFLNKELSIIDYKIMAPR
jgi:hypothetical protein